MKSGLLRLLMIVALSIAMPLKGIASVTMLGCLSHAGAVESHAGVAVDSHIGHAGHSDHSATDELSRSHPDHQSPGSHADAKVQCGTCAPCCAGAALANTFLAAVAELPVAADFPASATPHPSSRQTRLYRPPRPLAA